MQENNKQTMWDDVFGQDEYVYGKEPNDYVRATIQKKGEGDVICLAEGEGRNAVYIAGMGYTVTAVDSSANGLAKTRALALERGVKVNTVEADLSRFRIEKGVWQGAVMVFGHFPPPVRKFVLNEVVEGLSEGGFFLMEAYSKDQLKYGTGGPPVAELLYDLDEIMADLNGRLDLKIAHKIERVVVEGNKHNGRASVIQIFGHKTD